MIVVATENAVVLIDMNDKSINLLLPTLVNNSVHIWRRGIVVYSNFAWLMTH